MRSPEEIDAGPVVLRRWREDQAEVLASAVAASLPELRVFLPWATDEYDVVSAADFLRECDRHWEAGTELAYGIHAHDGELVGSACLTTRMGPGVLEIGYWVHSAHAGRGHATAAAQVLARLGLELAPRVVIRHNPDNLASRRVAERAGFTRVAHVPPEEAVCPDGSDAVVWELLRTPASEVS